MFKYYNANPLGRNVSDCAVRAISLATNRSWDEIYCELSEFARREGITFSEIEFLNNYLLDNFERFYLNRRKIHTIKDFQNLKLKGTYLITMPEHITCVIDSILYDTFDCSDQNFWCIYKV